MGRVSREQAGRNRERVLATACRLFRQYGVENVSIADIMKEAGLTPGGFYKQFASKEALVDEAFESAFAQSSRSWERIGKHHDAEPFQGLHALVRRYFKHRPREPGCPMLVFSSLVGGLSADPQATAIYSDGVRKLYEQFMAAASRAPDERGPETLTDADMMVLFAAMVGAGMLTRAMGETAFTRQLQSAVLGALPEPRH